MVITGALIPQTTSFRQTSPPSLPKNSHSSPQAIPLTQDTSPQNRGSNSMTQAITPISEAKSSSHSSSGASFAEQLSLKALHALDSYHQVQDNPSLHNQVSELYGVDEYA